MAENSDDIKSGVLLRKEVKGKSFQWKEFFFVLSGTTLYEFKAIKDAKKKSKAKEKIELTKVHLRIPPNLSPPETQPHTFQIVLPDTSVVSVSAKSDSEMSDWIEVLKAAQSGRTDLTRQTVQIQENLRNMGQEIPPEDLEFDDNGIIGTGASGVVKRGMWLKSTEVAVKALKNLPEFTDQKELVAFYKEIETLSKLRHSNIVQMYGFCRKGNFICLITEFVRGGNLADCLSKKDKYALDLRLQIELAMSIARGMVYLHSMNVIHRDLKPANILLESWEDAKAKVCDFGLSKVVKTADVQMTADTLGSPQYAAPELNSDSHTNKVDTFSFGIILWEICTRSSPWPELKFGWQFAEKYAKNERPPLPEHPLKDVIAKCWAKDPNDRPSFGQIYEEIEQVRVRHYGTPAQPGVSRAMSFSANGLTQYPARPQPVQPPPVQQPPPRPQPPPPQQPQQVESFYMAPAPINVRSLSSNNMRAPPVSPPPTAHNANNVESFYMNAPGTNPSPVQVSSPPSNHSPRNEPSYMTSQQLQQLSINNNKPRAATTSPPVSPHSSGTFASEAPYMTAQQVRGVNINPNVMPAQNPISPSPSRNIAPAPTPVANAAPVHQPHQPVNAIETKFTQLFGTKPKESWANLSKVFQTAMGADKRHISSIKYLFDDGGNVDKAIWDHFMLWFSPLTTEKNFSGFDIDTIVDIVDPTWFHGFLSSSDAQSKLKGFQDGTYLFRFSTTNPGYYALSVAYSGMVGHWRINSVKEPGKPIKFLFDEKEFTNLKEIILTYSKKGKGEPLKIKQPKPDQPPFCFLSDPYHRAEQYYQNIH